MHCDDRHNTACVAPDGFYEWMIIPFGLANAPSTFMRTLYHILGPSKRVAIVYLDDVLIFSHSLAEHKTHVDTLLLAIRAVHLELHEVNAFLEPLKRCSLLSRSIQVEFTWRTGV